MERYSPKRQAILDCLRATDCHPNAEWVFKQLRPFYPSLSLGTVYRNLQQLADAGVIRRVGSAGGEARFDANVCPHLHVVCDRCGTVADLEETREFDPLIRRVQSLTGYVGLSPQLAGLCPHCAELLNSTPPEDLPLKNFDGRKRL